MKIAMLLSGGVDSSVGMHLLKREGHEVTAFYLKVWLEDELAYIGECPWEEDLIFAREVCERMEFPLEIRSLQHQYQQRVVQYTIDELEAGRTPSPDIFCNKHIKFGAFLDEIDNSFDCVASGHYARLDVRGELVRLKRGIDTVKDQTYFLSQLHQDQIRRAYFPIGELTKSDVRQLACELDLPNKDRRDSQGICFLGKIKYSEFVRHHLGERVGDIINTENGQVLGLHQGYWFYTIGQRQGLGLSHGPWFVQRKDPVRNIIYVTHGKRLEETSCDSYRVTNLHWVASPPAEQNLQVRIRHGPEFLEASVKLEADSATVQLAHKEAGIAPGQFTVFYDGDICLGGATVVP